MRRYVECTVENGIAMMVLNRPEALNALNTQVLQELKQTADELNQNSSVKVVILTGAGQKAFAAGADIAEMQELNPDQAQAFSSLGQETMNRLSGMRALVIAAVNGFALGGGCELAMACDIRIASVRARMGMPEVTLGVIPGFGGTQRLARLVGVGKALEILATGRQLDAEEAKCIGLVNEVTEPENLISRCLDIAEHVTANSASAITLAKQAVLAGSEMAITHGLQMESGLFALTFATPDQKEGMSAFLAKRKACFQ